MTESIKRIRTNCRSLLKSKDYMNKKQPWCSLTMAISCRQTQSARTNSRTTGIAPGSLPSNPLVNLNEFRLIFKGAYGAVDIIPENQNICRFVCELHDFPCGQIVSMQLLMFQIVKVIPLHAKGKHFKRRVQFVPFPDKRTVRLLLKPTRNQLDHFAAICPRLSQISCLRIVNPISSHDKPA